MVRYIVSLSHRETKRQLISPSGAPGEYTFSTPTPTTRKSHGLTVRQRDDLSHQVVLLVNIHFSSPTPPRENLMVSQ